MKYCRLATTVAVSIERGVRDADKETELKMSCLIKNVKNKGGYRCGHQYRKESPFTMHWFVSRDADKEKLHKISCTIRYEVKTRVANREAVITERINKKCKC